MEEDYQYELNAFETCQTCVGLGVIAEHRSFVNPGGITDKGEKCTTGDGDGKTIRNNFFKPNDELADHLLGSGFKRNHTHNYKPIFIKGKFSVVFDHRNIVISVNFKSYFGIPWCTLEHWTTSFMARSIGGCKCNIKSYLSDK